MNISAIVLVETEPGKSRDVARKIAGIPGIISSFPVTGPYDVIAAVSFKHLENMTSIVLPAV